MTHGHDSTRKHQESQQGMQLLEGYFANRTKTIDEINQLGQLIRWQLEDHVNIVDLDPQEGDN